MKPLGHAVITLTAGGVLYKYNHSFAGFLSFLITGILVDMDHYFDYIRENGISFNLSKVYKSCSYYGYFKKLILFLHSYELLIALMLALLSFNLNIIWTYIALGLGLHILTDQITNPVLPFSYFLSFRIMKGFRTEKIFLTKGGGSCTSAQIAVSSSASTESSL